MGQYHAWEKEYQNPQLVSKGEKPQKDVLRLFKYLKKEQGVEFDGLQVLDLGCGTGRNSNYLAGRRAVVSGLEISETAISLAKRRAAEEGVQVDYRKQDIGAAYPYEDNQFDLVIDITASNSLDEQGRAVYLKEVARTLAPGGFFLVRALCKDGDKNAKQLIKQSPGKEHDTYMNKDMNLIERVFTEKDFRELYGEFFEILSMNKRSGYARFKNQRYKRNYWLVIMKKKQV
jgi:SAM-dependent methyltransferase